MLLTIGTGASLHLPIQTLCSSLSGQFEMLDSKRIGPTCIYVAKEREREKKERERDREREGEINVHVHAS